MLVSDTLQCIPCIDDSYIVKQKVVPVLSVIFLYYQSNV